MVKPVPESYAPYYESYIARVSENDLTTAFNNRESSLDNFLNSIDESRTETGYAPGKWTIKDIIQHLTDCERIFGYRAVCIARGEDKSLPGFDEVPYAQMAKANKRTWSSLCEEFKLVRISTGMMFESFQPEALLNIGTANDHSISPLALGFIIIGHSHHHINIIKERYLTVM